MENSIAKGYHMIAKQLDEFCGFKGNICTFTALMNSLRHFQKSHALHITQ